MAQMYANYATQILIQSTVGSRQASRAKASPPSSVSTKLLFNPQMRSCYNFVLGIMEMLLMLMCRVLPALNIVGEKESGTIKAINVTPVSKIDFILAKLIPHWVIAVMVMTVCLVLAWVVYGITSAGSLGLVYLLAMLPDFIFSGLGLVISNYNDTMQQAVFVRGGDFACIAHQVSALGVIAIVMNAWAVMSYRKNS